MNTFPIITALAAASLGLSICGHAADAGKKSPAPDTTLPQPRSDTQVPLPIPPDHANGAGNSMKPPADASMGAVDPKYKRGSSASGEEVTPR